MTRGVACCQAHEDKYECCETSSSPSGSGILICDQHVFPISLMEGAIRNVRSRKGADVKDDF